jgi:hypothetical protein
MGCLQLFGQGSASIREDAPYAHSSRMAAAIIPVDGCKLRSVLLVRPRVADHADMSSLEMTRGHFCRGPKARGENEGAGCGDIGALSL